jgi:hypothetical protein
MLNDFRVLYLSVSEQLTDVFRSLNVCFIALWSRKFSSSATFVAYGSDHARTAPGKTTLLPALDPNNDFAIAELFIICLESRVLSIIHKPCRD